MTPGWHPARDWVDAGTTMMQDGVAVVVLETRNGVPVRTEPLEAYLLRTTVVVDWDGTPYEARDRPDLERIR